MKKNFFTIKEIEEESDDSIEVAMEEFVESCHRVGKHDEDENVKFFMQENCLAETEEDEVRRLYQEYDEK